MALGDYYDIDSILVEEERAPCVFKTSAFNLGYLDPGKGGDDLAGGTRIPLPLWLALHLARKGYVALDVPSHYGERMQSRLSADAKSVPVRDRSAHYFEVGVRLCAMLSGEEGAHSVYRVLRSAMGQRADHILSQAQSSLGRDVTAQCRPLTDEERKLYELTRETCLSYEQWKTRKRPHLAAASVVTSTAKRRRRS